MHIAHGIQSHRMYQSKPLHKKLCKLYIDNPTLRPSKAAQQVGCSRAIASNVRIYLRNAGIIPKLAVSGGKDTTRMKAYWEHYRKTVVANRPDISKHTNWGRYGWREDIDLAVRSSWEANYARYLKYKGVKYQYEPERFHLKGLNTTYCPDFKLENNKYVEIKGRDSSGAKAKRKAFRKQYGHKLVVIGPKRYWKLKRLAHNKIEGWERDY